MSLDSGMKWRSEVQILPVMQMEDLLSLCYEWVVDDGSFLHPSSNSVSSHLTRLALDQIIITVVWMIIRFTQRHGWLQHLQTPVHWKSTFWFGGFHYEADFSLFHLKHHEITLKYSNMWIFFSHILCVIHYIKGSWIVFVPWEIINDFFLILQTIFDSWFYDGFLEKGDEYVV